MFLRVTQAISRQQEYAADEQAARIAGAQPTIEGFRKAPGIAIAFKAFWNTEVVPILRSGFYPQLAEGFSQFLTTRSIADSLVRVSEEIIKRQQANPYDTHPTLRERIAAIEALRVTDYVHDDTPAISLLNDVPAMEQELFTHMFGAASMSELKPIAWQNVGEQVYIPQWQTVTEQYAAALQGVALVSLPEFLHFPNPLTRQVQQSARKSLTKEELDEATTYILGAALSITLLQQGWKLLESMPGQAFSLRKDDSHIEPFTQISNLASGELTVEEWRRQCEQFGISNLMLVS